MAFVLKAHGIKGEIFICPFNINSEWPHPIKEIFIEDSLFSVKKYSKHKNGLIVELENCQTRSSAEALKSQSVFLPKELFESKKGDKIYLTELTSFSVKVLGQGKIGTIQSFQSDKYQDFLIVQLDAHLDARDKKTNLDARDKKTNSDARDKKTNSDARDKKTNSDQILIPFVKSYIKDINFSEKTILLELPKDYLQTFS